MKAFKNAWTGINISVVVTIFTLIPLIANKKVLFFISQFVFQESSDVTTLLIYYTYYLIVRGLMPLTPLLYRYLTVLSQSIGGSKEELDILVVG